MADNDRIVYPDEVEDVKAAAAEAADQNKGGDTNTIEETPVIMTRNMIQVPPNCPPGYEMGPDGVCREVLDF